MRYNISAPASSRRESSRHVDGRFGEQEFERSSSVDLGTPEFEDDWATVLSVDDDRLRDAQDRLDDAGPDIAEQARLQATAAAEREQARAAAAHAARLEADRRARQAVEDEERTRAEARAARLAALPDVSSLAMRERETDDGVFGEEFLRNLQAVAHRPKYASQDFDADDLVGDAALKILQAERSGQLQEPSRIPRAYIDTVMHAHSVKELSGRQSRHVTAYGKYTAALDAEQSKHGRELTPGEQDALAERVRLSITAQNRPGPGYHRMSRTAVASLDSTSEEGRPKYDVAQTKNPYAQAEYTDDDNAMLELAEQLEAEGDDNPAYRAALQRRAWAVNAAIVNRRDGSWRRPVPTPLSRQLPTRAVTNALDRVRATGGAVATARQWLDGDRGTGESLFVPFGDLSEEDRDAVADFIVEQADEHGEGAAETMFTSAAGQARSDASDTTTLEVDRMLGLNPQTGGARR